MEIYDHEYLDERLAAYADTDYYPFHMPGHKRVLLDFENPYKIDITEIEGFDNLHHPEEILLRSQERLSSLYNSRKSYYLINGSTCGLLSAVGALTKFGESIIIARNCHKAVYNAAKLFHLKTYFIYPQLMDCGIQGSIQPEELERCLSRHPETRLAVITSPTYDGIVSDIRKLAEITHKYHAYLIIDEAHGAHFSLSGYFPESAVRQDADLVIQSFHKTLPAFTQTAALHIASGRIDDTKVEEMLRMFQSSSPSYLLMAGMEKCVRMLEQSKEQLFDAYQEKLSCFYETCRPLKRLHVLTRQDYEPYPVYAIDRSKILVSTQHSQLTGQMLYEILLHRYHLQMELYSAQYVLAMTSIMDTQEGFDRLSDALIQIDSRIDEFEKNENKNRENTDINNNIDINRNLFLKKAYAVRKKILEVSEIDSYYIEETPLEKCCGKICAEYIYLYPPGIPMIVPGELLTEDFIEVLHACRRWKLNVRGTKDAQYRKILAVAYSTENKL